MSSCHSCGLSISGTAEFCPTCGARPQREAAAGAASQPASASAETAAPDGSTSSIPLRHPSWAGVEATTSDVVTQSSPLGTSAAQPSALRNNNVRLAIAAGVVLLVIVLVAVFVHSMVSGTGSEKYTQSEADQLQLGWSLAQAEAVLGTPTSHMQEKDGSMLWEWDNEDASFVAAHFVNDALIDRTYNDFLKRYMGRHALGAWGIAAVLFAFTGVLYGVCLFFAPRLFGYYSVTVEQVIIFAVITGGVRLVPYIGWLLPLIVGASLIERWSGAGWWTSLLIVLVAGFLAWGVTFAVLGLGSGLGMAL